MTRQQRKATLKLFKKLNKAQRYSMMIASAKIASTWPEDKPLNVARTMSYLADINKPYNKPCVICNENIATMSDSHNPWPVVKSEDTFTFQGVLLSEDEDNVCCSHCNKTVVQPMRLSEPQKYCGLMTKKQYGMFYNH